MRIVHLIKVTGISGAEKHLILLLAGLRAKDVDARMIVLVEADKPMDEYVKQLEAQQIPVQREVIHNDVDVSLITRLRRIFREMKPDIVHTHLWHADVFGITAARLAGVKTVITSRHNDDAFRHKAAIRFVNRLLWRMVSGGIAISEAIRHFTIEVEGAPSAKVQTVHYGLQHRSGEVDRPAARKTLRDELHLSEDALLVGMACRLTEQKGVSYGIQAFARVAAEFPDAHLIIAGDGSLRSQLEAEVKKCGVADKVHFLGWCDDMMQILAALDVFLMPSLWEGFGLVLLEAMAQQIPIIGSRVSAIPEVVAHEESGLLVAPRDVEGMANALRQLLADKPLRRHMGLLGEDRLDTHFSVGRMVEQTLGVYERVARKR